MDLFVPEMVAHVGLWKPVAVALRRAIILGELRPGVRLEEPALSDKFGVSRNPIREALLQLQYEGLVRIEPRRGAYVVGVTEEEIGNVYELRLLLETQAVLRAAARIDAEDTVRLQALANQVDEAIRRGQLQSIAEPDVAFHRQIVLASGNRRLLIAWDTMAGLIETILSITDATYYRAMPEATGGHHLLIRALEQRDADAAERELRRHLRHGEGVMRETMRSVRAGDDLISSRAMK